MKRWRVPVAVTIALWLAAGCGGAAPAAPRPAGTVRAAVPFAIGFPATSADFTPLYVGVARGFFKRNGLNVRLKLLSGSSSETAALLSNSVQVIVADANPVLAAIAEGTNLRFFASQIDVFPMSLWARPSMTSVKQLEGSTLGLLHVASLADSAARENLPKLGVDLSKVKIVYLGAPATAVAALIAGRVPDIVADPPQVFEAQAKGFHELVDFSRFHHVSSAYVATPGFLRRHPRRITDFLKGYVESVAYIQNPANRSAVETIIGRYTKTSGARILSETYAYYRPLYQCDPKITPADLEDSVRWTLKYGHAKVDPAGTIDARPLKALDASGFVRRTCGSRA